MVKKDAAEDVNDVINTALLKSSAHFLTGEIEEENIKEVIKWIVYENVANQSEGKVLTLYINSNGGNLYDAFALIDIMQSSKYPIKTIGIGSILSAAFLIFISGTKGYRHIAKNTSIMCHQFSDSMENKYHDLKSAMVENERNNKKMMNLLVECMGMDVKTVKAKLLPPTDVWLDAEELVQMGGADFYFKKGS